MRASRAAPKSRRWSPRARHRDLGHATRMARRSIPEARRRSQLPSASAGSRRATPIPCGSTWRRHSRAPAAWGDDVLARKETPTSYHLSVVIDDALQGVSQVVRGQDLFWSTSVHRLLQALLGLPVPTYHHHRLVLDAEGRKLSKSTQATALRMLRQAGATPADIRKMVGLG